MITFVMLVEGGNLDNAVGTLENNLPRLIHTWNVLVLTKDKNYPRIRNRIYETLDTMPNQQFRGECLVTYNEKTTYKQARSFLTGYGDFDYVYLWNNGKVPMGVIQELIDICLDHFLHTGLVGYGDTYYALADDKLYNQRARMKKCSPKQRVTQVTATPINNVLLRASTFMQCSLENDKIGLELRRKGYQNFLLRGGK